MTPRESAQAEAEKTFEGFILWSKRTAYAAIAFLLIVAFLVNYFCPIIERSH